MTAELQRNMEIRTAQEAQKRVKFLEQELERAKVDYNSVVCEYMLQDLFEPISHDISS